MSSLFKGVRKAFKKVAKGLKKIAGPVLAAAAIIFTGGAALGIGAMAGGWSTAAASIVSSVGLTGTAGAVVTGAITQAGYGALIGGVASKLSGGSFSKGARQGAKVGAVTGGLMTGINQLAGVGGGNAASATASQGPVSLDAAGKVIPTPESVRTFALPEAGQSVSSASAAAAAPVAATTTKGGLLSRAGQFIKDNPEITGNIIKGVGSGLLAGAEADAHRDAIRERYDRVAENYDSDPGRNYREAAPGAGQTPVRRFDPDRYRSFRYEYNTTSGRIERVPTGG